VELVLPETGVCSGPGPLAALPQVDGAPAAEAAGCCGGPPVENKSACCVKDEKAKAEGKAGCGCGS
ncbi:MAG TPA: hypothetical protein VEC14_09705, partial [Reyranellaceae bacterium]|nr:hypothetical protein [Reyranellaceae bacterium]